MKGYQADGFFNLLAPPVCAALHEQLKFLKSGKAVVLQMRGEEGGRNRCKRGGHAGDGRQGVETLGTESIASAASAQRAQPQSHLMKSWPSDRGEEPEGGRYRPIAAVVDQTGRRPSHPCPAW